MKDQILAGVGGLIVGVALSFMVKGDDMTPKHYMKIKPGMYETHVEVIVGGGYVASAELLTRSVFEAFFEKRSGRLLVNGVDLGEVSLRYSPDLINTLVMKNETSN